MDKATFSLKEYKFDKIFVDLENQSSKEIKIDFKPAGIFRKSESSTFELTFTFIAFDKNPEKPFIRIRCVALFKFESNIRFEEVPDYFYTNSIAILFPFVRAFVSTITLQANILPPIMLPTWNLVSLAEPLKQNTTISNN
ncbi:MAG: protein-export chaperone SecB [Dysgonamonadaceae bacterium]